jgi:hypothetical protein
VERRVAEAIYGRGRDAVVEVLLALSAQNERLGAQVERLTARVVRQDERIATLERQLGRCVAQLVAAAQQRSAGCAAAAWRGSVGSRAGRPARA